MEYTFNIVIANIKKRINQIWYLHIMSALLVLVFAMRGFINLPKTSFQLILGLPVFLFLLFACFFKKSWLLTPKVNRTVRLLECSMVALTALHFYNYGYSLQAIAFGFTVLLLFFSMMIEQQLLTGVTVKLNDLGVTRKVGAMDVTTPWQEIYNVILRDNLLTVELKNNSFLQAEISDVNVDVAGFNNWCKGKL